MKMTEAKVTIRTMSRKELNWAVDLAAQEGWNPGLYDAQCFFETDPNGFFIAEAGGKPIGCVSAVAYNESFGFTGFFIVLPDYRAQGIGGALAQAALRYLGDRNVGLDGVVAQQENYKRNGFKLIHRNIRYGGHADGELDSSDGTFPLSEIPFDELLRYDTRLFPAPRPAFLKSWIFQPDAVGYAVKSGSAVSGYALMRPCREGYKIGPLFADSQDDARRLLCAVCCRLPKGQRVFLDVPEPNCCARMLAAEKGMSPVFETARMYNRRDPALPLERIYGITSFELG